QMPCVSTIFLGHPSSIRGQRLFVPEERARLEPAQHRGTTRARRYHELSWCALPRGVSAAMRPLRNSLCSNDGPMSKIFISCVTGEFGGYRSRLAGDLGTSAVHWITQEQLPQSRFDTVLKLDTEIRECDAVVHIIGRGAGEPANSLAVSELLNNPVTKNLADR